MILNYFGAKIHCMTVHNRNTNSSNWLKRLLIKIQICFSRLVLLEKSGFIVRNKLISHSDFIWGSKICALQEVRDDLYETKLNHLRDFRRYITFKNSRTVFLLPGIDSLGIFSAEMLCYPSDSSFLAPQTKIPQRKKLWKLWTSS